MRSLAVKFLVLTLFSCSGYAGPINGGPGSGRIGPNNRPDIRPDIRPGQRGSNIQEALGSSLNQYSPLNPGSNQSVFLLNNFISQQLLNDGPGGTSDVSFNPINPLLGGPFGRDIQSEGLPLVERDITSNFILMPPPKPFASTVVKSRTQGMVFISKSSQSPGVLTNLTYTDSYIDEPGFATGVFYKFKMSKDQSAQAPIWSPVGSSYSAKLSVVPSQEAKQVEQALMNETQKIQQQLTIFNNMLQSTEQTLGRMSQPISSDSSGSSGSK